MSSLGLYIHVPFCGKKCAYCDFYSLSYSCKSAAAYVEAVLRNLRHYSDRSRITDTVYFGGGTPSLLAPHQLSLIMDEVRESFCLAPDAEVTLEANPCTLSPERLSGLLESGITRLSIGVQSMNDSELAILGRAHDAKRAEKAVSDAYSAGFRNISCDLMTGLPGQTAGSVRYSAERLAALPIQHISSYLLKVEEGTPFAAAGVQDTLPDEEALSEIYLQTAEILGECGFIQYEISNFALPGFESRHNCRYWKCQDYIGIGPSAHSCCGGKRFAAERSLQSFIEHPVQQTEVTDASPCGFEEYVMLRLRLSEGLPLSDIPEHRRDIEKKIPALLKAGYAEYDGEILRLTPGGFLVSNSVISYLIY